VLELLGGVQLELFGDRHVLRALEGLRVDDVGDDGLILARQVFLEPLKQIVAGDGRHLDVGLTSLGLGHSSSTAGTAKTEPEKCGAKS